MGTETFVQMNTSINGENSMGKNKCQGGRKEFWRHKGRKMKKICCCLGFLLLLNLFVTFCVLFHTGAILHEVHELKDMDSKSFCSSFCMDFCEDNDCDDVYTCRDLCQTNVESTLGSMESSSSDSDDSNENYEEEEEVDEETSTVVDDEETSTVVDDQDTEVNDEDDSEESVKLGGDEDYQQHGALPPPSGGDEDYQQHGTTQQQPEEQGKPQQVSSSTDNLPATNDDTNDETLEETPEDNVDDNDSSSTTGDGHGRGHGGPHHRPEGNSQNGSQQSGGRQSHKGRHGRGHGHGGRFRRH